MKLYEQYFLQIALESKINARVWRVINKTKKGKDTLKKIYDKWVRAYRKFHEK